MFSENNQFSETYGRERLENSPFALFLKSLEVSVVTPPQVPDSKETSLNKTS